MFFNGNFYGPLIYCQPKNGIYLFIYLLFAALGKASKFHFNFHFPPYPRGSFIVRDESRCWNHVPRNVRTKRYLINFYRNLIENCPLELNQIQNVRFAACWMRKQVQARSCVTTSISLSISVHRAPKGAAVSWLWQSVLFIVCLVPTNTWKRDRYFIRWSSVMRQCSSCIRFHV